MRRLRIFPFQSTLPARGSDRTTSVTCSVCDDFNPRSPRGGATIVPLRLRTKLSISIHAPREGERPLVFLLGFAASLFQSTLPARGSDCPTGFHKQKLFYFNPRSPRGGATLKAFNFIIIKWYFNPRSPRGGATTRTYQKTPISLFQSTLPARGSDVSKQSVFVIFSYFNPRSPRGGATKPHYHVYFESYISIHAPREGERHIDV